MRSLKKLLNLYYLSFITLLLSLKSTTLVKKNTHYKETKMMKMKIMTKMTVKERISIELSFSISREIDTKETISLSQFLFLSCKIKQFALIQNYHLKSKMLFVV